MSCTIYVRECSYFILLLLLLTILSGIPHYWLEDATKAVRPLLGKDYLYDDNSYLPSLWQTFRNCITVETRTMDGRNEIVRSWTHQGPISQHKE